MSDEGLIALLVIGGILYAIYFIFAFSKRWNEDQEKEQLRGEAAAVQEGLKPMGKPMGHTFGSAYIMSPAQVREAGIGFNPADFFKRIGENDLGYLFFGAVVRASTKETAFASLEGPGHALTVAPTRTGKGTCVVIPNLLIYDGSVIVNDIKGENYAVTRRWRKRTGHEVYKVAPFEEDSDSWNPFDVLAHSDDAWDDAKHMVELLLPDVPGKDEFWTNGARNLLTGLILYIHHTAPDEKRTLSYLRDLLTQDQTDFDLTLAEMMNSDIKVAARSANVFQRADVKVQSGIMSTLDSELSFLDSDRLARCTESSSFDFRDLKEKKVSIYLVIPPERLRTYAPFMRLFMGLAALELKRTKTRPKFPVLLMLDEFPAMGRMKVIEDEISFLAGYDVRLWIFAQDLKQLASIYGDKAQSIIANCAVKQFFGVSDEETAKLVSFMCGSTTVPSISVSTTSGVKVETTNQSINRSARPLFDPNEVMTMDPRIQFLFFQGHQPIQSAKMSYLEHSHFFSDEHEPVFDENPYHRSG